MTVTATDSASDAWSIEFQLRTSKVTKSPPTHSISLVTGTRHSQWHVRATFCGILQISQQPTNWTKRWRDFRELCSSIDFSQLPLLDDTVTELLIFPDADAQFSRLPLRTLPSNDSDYAGFRKIEPGFRVQEYARRIGYPLYLGTGRRICLSQVRMGEEFAGADGVYHASIFDDEKTYVFKGVDRTIYIPADTEVLEQELRNLELFSGSHSIVQHVAAVVSINPYQTRRSEDVGTLVLRGILLEYHPNGTLHEVLKSPEAWMNGRWQAWALEITAAIACLHERGLTHMDVKPKNVVMSMEWTAVLIDVSGIAGITREWVLPELLDAPDPCSASWELRVRSDTWALGKILSSMAECATDGKEKLLLLRIAQEVQQSNGRLPLSLISKLLSQVA